MAPSSFYLCICNKCLKETTPACGNHQMKESVCGQYWKKNSATHKQHMQELRKNIIRSGTISSNSPDVHTQNIPNGKHVHAQSIPNGKQSQPDCFLVAGHSPQGQESAVKPSQCQQSAPEALDKSNHKDNSDSPFPVDMRTIISHLGIASQIYQRICCPKCFCLYPMDNKLTNCSFRATPKSHICQASLSISSHRKGDKSNSSPLEFTFQSLFEWLGMFLNCPGIEDKIKKSINHISATEYTDSEGRQFTRRHLICPTIKPVICDLPVKVLGLAGHSLKNHLCQFCHVNKDTLDIFDIDRFLPRSDKDVRYQCLRWKKESKVSKREQIFKQHGVGYSVSLKLPYFKLLDDAGVEPLHNVFLRLLNNHGTEFFGLKKNESKDTITGVEYKDVYGYKPVDDFLFSIPENLQLLRAVIDEIRLPSDTGRVPRTVGQPKGGKLRAEEWINLFSIVLIPTNIVHKNRVWSEDIQNLQVHLKTYCQGILRLYPQCSTKPNHHIALHLPECISRLGPAPYWTGWLLERLNGSLAALPTNQRISQLNSTLLDKWTTSQNFRSIFLGFCDLLPSQLAKKITKLMNPSKDPTTPERSCSDNSSDLPCNLSNPQFSKSKNLKPEDHLRLLKRLVEIKGHDLVGSDYFFKNWQKPKNPCPVLTCLINYNSDMSFGNFEFTTKEKHPGNSTIRYRYQNTRNRSKLCYGQILEIFCVCYQHEFDGPFVVETWLDVASFDELSLADQKLNLLIDWPYAHTHVTYQKQTARHFFKPKEVLAQTTLWAAPCRTLGIRSPINYLTEIKNHR
ncbi:hypothetical protein VP01_377g10 [Puccinia sorghi]|uniref:Uncharacterized protein n=1 Tax=Puccinia sorghi TaxID=27349 RepID=A0A0L6UUG9_9BASI|nr:hypothetical protein VP01_377g10 [Puccinia sorghi]